MGAYDIDNLRHAPELSEWLVGKMRLEDVTLAVPDDLTVGTTPKGDEQYEWFCWVLHEALVTMFQGGHLHSLRFAHPSLYATEVSAYDIHMVDTFLEDMLLSEYEEALQERKRLWGRYHKARRDGTLGRFTLGAFHDSQRALWHRAGYTLERDSRRPGEEGTVLVVRRTPASLKQRREEVTSSPEVEQSTEAQEAKEIREKSEKWVEQEK